MERTYIGDLHTKVGGQAAIQGWISVRRDQGKMVFFDFRDMTGTVQGVVLPKSAAMEAAKDASRESAVTVVGTVNKRPEKNITAGKQNGDIELLVDSLTIENRADAPPFEVVDDTNAISEDTRLDYRYLDLRRERMQRNIRVRSEFVRRVREFLFARKFKEPIPAVNIRAPYASGLAGLHERFGSFIVWGLWTLCWRVG